MRRIIFSALVSMIALNMPVVAESSTLNINGFLSSTITKTNHSTPYIETKEYTDNINYQSGTVLGFMMSKRLDDKVSFQAQLAARGAEPDKSRNFKPAFDMLFIDYRLRPNLSLKVGKFFPNTYLISKHLDVGASYLWARPPVEVYETSYSFLSRVNGLELTYHKKLGSMNLRLQPYLGRLSETLISRTTRTVANLDSESLFGFSADLESQNTHFHLSAMQADSEMLDGDGTIVLMPDVAIYSLGMKTEVSGWQFMTEIAHVEVGRGEFNFTTSTDPEISPLGILVTDIPPQTGYYISLARELGSMTPYFTLAATDASIKQSGNPILNAINNNFLQEQRSFSLGVRFYASDSLTMKLEHHHASLQNDTTGLFISQPVEDDDLQLWTIAFNILF